MFCANSQCHLPPLSSTDARIEIKARLPESWENFRNVMFLKWKPNGEAVFHPHCWSSILRMARARTEKGSRDAIRTGTVMKWAEKLLVKQAAKTLEKFDSLEDMKKAAKLAANLIKKSRHCIAFTGAGISTSAGLGDFRGKSGKWTEEDQSAADPTILTAFQNDRPGTSSTDPPKPCITMKKQDQSLPEIVVKVKKELKDSHDLAAEPLSNQSLETKELVLMKSTLEDKTNPIKDELTPWNSAVPLKRKSVLDEKKRSRKGAPGEPHSKEDSKQGGSQSASVNVSSCPEPSKKRRKSSSKDKTDLMPVKEESSVTVEDQDSVTSSEENVDYENLRPTYTHEALALLMKRGLMHYIVSQNCDGLHLLSGVSPDHISELHGNVFVEKCPACNKRYSRNFYVLHDEASQYYEEIEDDGDTTVTKPKFAKQCDLCGLCHRTGRRCEEPKCKGFLEDTIINFRDNLEEAALDRAMEESCMSDIVLCLGTTLTVTPAADIVEEAKGEKPLIICNRQKTEKDQLAKVRVFGDCDVFMAEILAHLIRNEEKTQWEQQRGERIREYNAKR